MDSKTKMWQLISTVSLIIAVIALIMPFVIPAPEGPEGPQGAPGEDGVDGMDGDDGEIGPQGPQGLTGPQGLQGLQGLQGPQGAWGTNGTNGVDGIPCWDLNENGVGDLPDEDITGDGEVNVADCTGATGPQGPMGPSGNGTVMAWTVTSMNTQVTNCTQLLGFTVTIDVPSDGHVVVTSTMVIYMEHTVGTADMMVILISPVPWDCTLGVWNAYAAVSQQQPTDTYVETLTARTVAQVPAGTHTFYVAAAMFFGPGPGDEVISGDIVAVFYPS